MRNIIIFFSLLVSNTMLGQVNYRVVYKAYVSNNVDSIYQERIEKGIIVNDFDGKKYPGEEDAKAKLFFEGAKSLDNRITYTGICSDKGQHFKVIVNQPDSIGKVNNVSYYDGMEYSNSIIHNYSNYYTTIIKERKSKTDTTRRLLDTAAMHMQPTGKTRVFNGRTCTEYEPREPRYRYFSLWADATLPAWVHPCLFWGLGVDGGIVAMTFKSGTHTLLLESITETGDPVPHIPYYEPPIFKYLPFGRQIGNYNSLQLPD